MRDLSWVMYKNISTVICRCIYKKDNYYDKDEKMPQWFFFGHIFFYFLAGIVGIVFNQVSILIGFLGCLCICAIIFVLPSLITMALNGGILHYMSFGMVKPKGNFQHPETGEIEMTPKNTNSTSKKLKDDPAGMINYVGKMILLNAMLYFGLLQMGLSFHILVTAIAGTK
jgi:hypothetical protein